MSEETALGKAAVTLNEETCSNCSTCTSLCPFEAIKRDETGQTTLDIEKCQVCGLCYATCPSHAIDTLYYDIDSLTRYLEQAKQEHAREILVIACKGSAPDLAEAARLYGIEKFIPLSVPCVGRIPEEVYLKALTAGVKEIHVLACDEDYCRFERGSSVTGRKILALNRLLEQLGYGREVIKLKRRSPKVKANPDLCISCGNCVFYCPYDAASLNGTGTVSFDLNACRGCGLCVAMCPSLALDLESWEKDRISALIARLVPELPSPKVLVFRCQWAVFPQNEDATPNVGYIDLPCASRVDKYHILEAFQKGAEGVMIFACAEEDCKQEKASGRAKHSVDNLSGILGQLGMSDRLIFSTVAPRFPEKFPKDLADFCQSLAATGT